MSALAVYLERQGISTVIIGLVRLHLEKIRPPRALWVPFELGRPLGPPNDAAFQTRVLRAALQQLTATQGPSLLADFPDDDPSEADDPQWRAPSGVPGAEISDEVQALKPLYQRGLAERERTAVGLSGLNAEQAADYVQRFGSDTPAENRHSLMSDLALMRFAADDLKAFYLEAAAAGAQPSSRQLAAWFWRQTRVAEQLRRIRELCLASDDRKYQQMAGSLVPRTWL